MGRQDQEPQVDPDAIRSFTKSILNDLQALERILDEGMIEDDIRRFGAEQELFLVGRGWRPACTSMEILERLEGPYTTELARYNLEINLEPRELNGACFSDLEERIRGRIGEVQKAADEVDTRVILAGILPTLSKSDLTLDNISPKPRYYALNEAMTRMRGGAYRLRIEGTDELQIEHDSVMLESCNTSCQVHLQVSAEEFSHYYNAAQVVTAPVLAAAVNSPLLFGRRLWAETRIALFQQSLDTRSANLHIRELSPRVRFGEHWARSSVVDLFQEDIARFRVIMALDHVEDPFAALDAGDVPRLEALQLHNSTVYRWNRPCYGILDGKPHLRIECRALPSGPTVKDEVANAALWLGAVMGLANRYEDVTEVMDFDDAKSNFTAAARLGLHAGLYWLDGETVGASKLIRESLLPIAREGLGLAGVDPDDADHYLEIIDRRVAGSATGTGWILRSLQEMKDQGTRAERLAALTAATFRRQSEGEPVHEWSLAELREAGGWKENYVRVEQYMTTDLFTVNEDELVDLVAFLMDKKQIRQVLVEDDDQQLVGLVSYRSILRLMAGGYKGETPPVKEIMERDPITISPEAPTLEAIDLMRTNRVSCLPVVKEGKLVGLVSERDFMPIAYHLLEARLSTE